MKENANKILQKRKIPLREKENKSSAVCDKRISYLAEKSRIFISIFWMNYSIKSAFGIFCGQGEDLLITLNF